MNSLQLKKKQISVKILLSSLILFLVLLSNSCYSQRPAMVLVKGGTFDFCDDDSVNFTTVSTTISDFYISKYEVTFDEFDLFCKSTGHKQPPDGGFGRESLPVFNVSWEDAVMYCNWLSRRFNLDKVYEISSDSSGMRVLNVNWENNGFRLPTVAEWQYAANGGDKKDYFENIQKYAWFKDNSNGRPQPVGTLKANNLGIYDMFGNVWEWCWDSFDKNYSYKKNNVNPHGSNSGIEHFYMGGGFKNKRDFLNSSLRFHFSQIYCYGLIGIRLVQKAN